MKKNVFRAIGFFCIIFPHIALAAEAVKLPYAMGERFVVTTGYDTPPMHIKKDSYAIDFTQSGCAAYGKPAVAAISGTAWFVEENGYNGGYGTQLLVLSDGTVVSRYAHLIPGSIPVAEGDAVSQGTIIGEIGDTGLVVGTACAGHPGTHIHFAMDTENADGSFTAKDSEPISGYADVAAGKWYVSDNALAATKNNLAALFEIAGNLFGDSVTFINPSSQIMPSSSVAPSPPSQSELFPPRLSSAPATASAYFSPPPFAASSSQGSFSQNALTPDSALAAKTASSTVSMSPGGGSGPSGGVSVGAAILGARTSQVAATSSLSSTDPLDDSVSVCE